MRYDNNLQFDRWDIGTHAKPELKGLEREGLVTRTPYPTIPTRVDCALAERGETRIPPMVALWPWAQDHQAAIETTSRAFDRGQKR
ncbi:winged helix-turn-helix transcriptional regulator [Bradyrhizobium sp. Rc2d]|uniref:winged helix-turn-helix transcriptional regulator n=1 Tax=Bradyrhizobium sp. Rc2d TaxID=1855321 RepID=UPI000B85A5E8|nr:winged helix-turn-helix transcriptional regulator [Bradyrhizobium sp. Rc2d]